MSFYVYVDRDPEGKKRAIFGPSHGELKKSQANAEAIHTGNGLIVIDVDYKEKIKDKKLRKYLKDIGPTVETGNGYHYYFETDQKFKTLSGILPKVDIRGEGGVIFTKYWGNDKSIFYKRKKRGRNPKLPKKLEKYLHKLEENYQGDGNEAGGYDFGELWSYQESGVLHQSALHYIIESFKSGLDEEVIAEQYRKWAKKCGINMSNRREVHLMNRRLREGAKFAPPVKLDGEMVGQAKMSLEEQKEAEIKERLLQAQKSGRFERVAREIKKEHGITMKESSQWLAEEIAKEDVLSEYFDGYRIVLNERTGMFTFLNDRNEPVKEMNNFVFTHVLSNKSSVTKRDALSEIKSRIPGVQFYYDPTHNDDNQIGKLNLHHGADWSSVDSKWKRELHPKLNMILENLFIDQPDAREYFMHWMAYIVQTGRRTGIAWGFFGVQGSGKTAISDILGRALGYENYSPSVGNVDLQSQFNGYMANKQLINLNEVSSDYHSRHGVGGKLKMMVSDELIQINNKNEKTYGAINYANIILNSNQIAPIEIEITDRRWNMITTPRPLNQMEGFESFTVEELAGPLWVYLNQMNLDRSKALHLLPMNAAKREIIFETNHMGLKLAHMLLKKDADLIIEELDITDLAVVEEVEKAVKNSIWSKELLTSLYGSLVGKRVHFTYIPKMIKRYLNNVTLLRENRRSLYDLSKAVLIGND